MNQDQFTEKSLEALGAAQKLAAKFHHQQMDVEHLLLALLDQERGLATSILTKAEVPVDALKIKLQRELERLPKISGSTSGVGMTGRQRLLQVEMPLALPVILAGIRLSVVVSVEPG